MEENPTKTCDNCKRDIPLVNFLVHEIHCVKNIRLCPVCKEPVPQHELEEHHKKQHELLPCKQCGEMVCGTDLEDHIRDSCANTKQICRYCELELPRREIPMHESYCGSRTEQCPECEKWVQIKYRQLHLESNHGFIKLDDEPQPMPLFRTPKKLSPRSAQNQNGLSPRQGQAQNSPSPRLQAQNLNNFGPRLQNLNGMTQNLNSLSPRLGLFQNGLSPIASNGYNNSPSASPSPTDINQRASPRNTTTPNSKPNGPSRPDQVKRRIQHSGTEHLNLPNFYGDGPSRSQDQIIWDQRISPNRGSLGGVRRKEVRPKKSPAPPPPDPVRDRVLTSAVARRSREDHERAEANRINAHLGLPPVLSAAEKLEKLRKMDALHNREEANQDYRNVLQGRVWRSPDHTGDGAGYVLGRPHSSPQNLDGLCPMSEAEFLQRLERLQTGDSGPRPETAPDRFQQIKSGLTHLRRELNQVTAPYNANMNPVNNAAASSNNGNGFRNGAEPVSLPCEFCGEQVAEADFLQHQGECVGASGVADIPLIPCEFCTESHPFYLIQEHQVNCRQRNNEAIREPIDVVDG